MEVASEKPPFELKAHASFEDTIRKLLNGFDVCGPKAANAVNTKSTPAGGSTSVNQEKPPAGNENCNESHTTACSSSLNDEPYNTSVETGREQSANNTTIDTAEDTPTNQSQSLEISEEESAPNDDEIEVTLESDKVGMSPVENGNLVENNGRAWMARAMMVILALLMALGAFLNLDGNLPLDLNNLEGVSHQIKEALTTKLMESTQGLLNIKELVEDSVATVIQQLNEVEVTTSESDPDGCVEKDAFSEIMHTTDDCDQNVVDTDNAKSTEKPNDDVSEVETEPVATGNTTDVPQKYDIDPPTSEEGISKEGVDSVLEGNDPSVGMASEMPESVDQGKLQNGLGLDSAAQAKKKRGEHDTVGTMNSDEL
jgi:hypothetical protein